MNLTIFIPKGASQNGKLLQHAVEINLYPANLQVIDTFTALEKKLKGIYNLKNEILIILAESHHQLNRLSTISNLLGNKQTIFILPDDSKENVSKASRFFPRFFTPVSDNYDDLCEVINKMAAKDKFNKN